MVRHSYQTTSHDKFFKTLSYDHFLYLTRDKSQRDQVSWTINHTVLQIKRSLPLKNHQHFSIILRKVQVELWQLQWNSHLTQHCYEKNWIQTQQTQRSRINLVFTQKIPWIPLRRHHFQNDPRLYGQQSQTKINFATFYLRKRIPLPVDSSSFELWTKLWTDRYDRELQHFRKIPKLYRNELYSRVYGDVDNNWFLERRKLEKVQNYSSEHTVKQEENHCESFMELRQTFIEKDRVERDWLSKERRRIIQNQLLGNY